MKSTIASRFFRARDRFLRGRAMMMMDCRSSSCHSIAVHFGSFHPKTFTTGRSSRIGVSGGGYYRCRNPWDVSRTNPYFFKHLNGFLSESPTRPPQHPGSMPNGYAALSTSTGTDVVGTKQAAKQEQKTTVVKEMASGEQIADKKILRTIVKYLWLKDNLEFRLRVLAALGFLVGAKVLNVQVPFLFKLAVDWLTTATGNSSALASFTTANSAVLALFASPAAILVGYGIARAGASAFSELRSAVFSKVVLRAIRSISRKVFSHLHELDLRYHLRHFWCV